MTRASFRFDLFLLGNYRISIPLKKKQTILKLKSFSNVFKNILFKSNIDNIDLGCL